MGVCKNIILPISFLTRSFILVTFFSFFFFIFLADLGLILILQGAKTFRCHESGAIPCQTRT